MTLPSNHGGQNTPPRQLDHLLISRVRHNTTTHQLVCCTTKRRLERLEQFNCYMLTRSTLQAHQENQKPQPQLGLITFQLCYLLAADGAPDRWKWICCHLPSFLCHTLVSSDCIVLGIPLLHLIIIIMQQIL